MDVTNWDDPESVDAGEGGLDLTPRAAATPRRGGRGRSWGLWAVFGGIVVAVVVLGWSLVGASTYFYNVDEAVAQREEIGDKRIRLQGNVVEGSIEEGDRIRFVLSYNDVDVRVQHTGEVPDLFGASIPLVIEGRFVGDEFHSDRVLIKHDEKYEEDHGDRLTEAERDAREASAGAIGEPDDGSRGDGTTSDGGDS